MKREYEITGFNQHGEAVTERITVEETGGLSWPKAILHTTLFFIPLWILVAGVVWIEPLDRAQRSLWLWILERLA